MSKIAIVTPEYPGMRRPSFGGIAAQYAVMAPALAALGEEVQVLVPGAEDGVEERDGVVVRGVRVPARTGPAFALARCLATRRALAGLGGLDTVLVADWSGNGAFMAADQERRLLTHLHTGLAMMFAISKRAGEDPGATSFRARLQLWLERRQGERSHALLGCSQAILDFAEGHWQVGSKPRAVLPNVIDPERVRSLAAARAQHPTTAAGSPLIIAPGRLETRKGVQVLVRAMEAVWSTYPDAILALAGSEGIVESAPAGPRLRELAGSRADRMLLTGPLPQAELFPTLAAADVVVTPSLWEAFGIVTLEAMALGRRIVATTGSGFEEFCRDGVNSILVAPGDEGALATGILQALRSDAAALGESAVATADSFSASHRSREYRDKIAALSA